MNNDIRSARMEAGLTQAELAEWLGIPKRTIENWEQGSRKPSPWLEKLLIEKISRDAAEYKNGSSDQ
ncbi:MAG TPA: helix-turn-helix domain-containing protein [Candidatus Avilachnospira avicola]|nr:helix-turn-helix domain-containing protein [Candidatus Avilachnospira avicola]